MKINHYSAHFDTDLTEDQLVDFCIASEQHNFYAKNIHIIYSDVEYYDDCAGSAFYLNVGFTVRDKDEEDFDRLYGGVDKAILNIYETLIAHRICQKAGIIPNRLKLSCFHEPEFARSEEVIATVNQ